MTIDEGSTAAISTIYHSAGTTLYVQSGSENEAFIELRRDSQFVPEVDVYYGSIAAGAVIFSRQTSSGLLVSTAPLSRGYQYGQAVDGCRDDQWNDTIMVDWGAADPAILQGYFVRA